jgi:adenosine deaminase
MRFAETHLHLYGTIRPEPFLEWVHGREVDWGYYEQSYERAYGSRPPVRDIVARHRAGDPAAPDQFADLFVFGDADGGSFERFQAKFSLLISGSEIVRLHRYADPVAPLLREMEYFIRSMLADQRRDQVGYAEQRLLIGTLFPRESTLRVLDGVLGIYREEARRGLTPRLAIGCEREDPWPMWEIAKELALGRHGEFVTGIDFCDVEEGSPPKDKATFFKTVRAFNDQHPDHALAILYHVGESFTDKSLESAIRWVHEAAELGAHRLGHAIALGVEPACYGTHTRSESVGERLDQIAYDLEHRTGLERRGVRVDRADLDRERQTLRLQLPGARVEHAYDAARLEEVRRRQDYAMDRVRASGAVVEVCPTSNRRIGDIVDPRHHPVHRFLERDVPFVVATDDPGIFDTTPAREIAWVVEHAGLEPEAFDSIARRAWDYRSEVITGRTRR